MTTKAHPRIAVVAASLDGELRTAIRAAADIGAAAVVADAFAPSLRLGELSQTGRRELLRHLCGCDVRLAALQCRLGADGLSPGADIDRKLDRLRSAALAAADLRCGRLLVDLGPLPPPTTEDRPATAAVTPELAGLIIIPEPAPPAPASTPTPRDLPFESSLDQALAALGEFADRVSCAIAFRSQLGSFASLHRALKSVRCSWFGVDLDPIALLAEDMPAEAVLSMLAPLLQHVRVRDGVRGLGHRTQAVLLGEGRTDWPRLLRLLDEAGYSGPLTIDPADLPNQRVAASLATERLQRLLRG